MTLDKHQTQLVGAAASQRHDAGVIVPLFANGAFTPFLKNLLCSMRRVAVQSWMVIAMDNATCPSLKRGGFIDALAEKYACVEPYGAHPLVGASVATYGSVEFWRLVVQRPLWVRWLLVQGYSVLQCDVDVVWLRDPLPYFGSRGVSALGKRCGNPGNLIKQVYSNRTGRLKWQQRKSPLPCPHHNSTLLVQSEMGFGYNCGFYLVRPGNSSVSFIDAWLQEMLQPTKEKSMHEQHAGHAPSRTLRTIYSAS